MSTGNIKEYLVHLREKGTPAVVFSTLREAEIYVWDIGREKVSYIDTPKGRLLVSP